MILVNDRFWPGIIVHRQLSHTRRGIWNYFMEGRIALLSWYRDYLQLLVLENV